MELRDYQERAIEKLREVLRQGYKRPLLVLPTGAGKSIIFGQVIKNVFDNDKTSLWLVHRRNLVNQMSDTLKNHFSIDPGIIMAGQEYDIENKVQLGTIQTFARRLKLGEDTQFNIPADVVLVDEGHRSVAKQYQDVLKHYQDKIIIGCTATPCRSDGRGLGEVYDIIVEIADVKELTDKGYLCPVEYYAPVEVELDGITIRMNDYAVDELARKMIDKKLIGDVVQNWLKHAEDRKTLVYGVNVKHSIALCDEFNRMGIPAAHLDAKHNDDQRDKVFHQMECGEIKVICNVGLYQEGMDVPDISCVQIARPTKSLGLYRQMVGRGLRPADGKNECIILDHGNVIEEHGFINEEVEWTLDGKEIAWKKTKPKEKQVQKVKCRVCHKIFEGLKECPDCGTPLKKFGKSIETIEAELEKVSGNRKYTVADKRRYWGMVKYWVANKGKSQSMAFAKFKTRFGVWPHSSYKDCEPIEPDQEFLNLMKHDIIKWAKRKEKERKLAEAS